MTTKTQRIKVIISLIVVLLATATWLPQKARAATFMVTTNVDELTTNGLCSLRG